MPINKVLENIFYLFVFILPWQTIFLLREVFIAGEKFQYGTIGIYLFELILFFWIFLNIRKVFICTEKKLIFILSFYCLWIFLSIFWSTNKHIAFYFFIHNFLGVILFLIIQSSALNFKKFSFSLVASTTLGSILGLYQFFSQATFSNKWLGLSQYIPWQGGVSVIENGSFRVLRAYGTMPHPNIFGGLLAIVILLSLGAYLKANKNELRWKTFLILTIPINFVAILTTFSRSAFLALTIGAILIIFYFFFFEKSKKKKDLLVILYALVIITSLFFVAYSDLISSRTNLNSRLEKKSLIDRGVYLSDAKKIINKHLFIGVGAGNYTENVLINNIYHRKIWHIQPVHNIYLLIFSELGLIGFFILMFFIVFNLFEISKIIKEQDTNRVIFSFILIAMLVLSIFDHWLWTTPFGIIIFWLVLAFSKEKDLKCV